LLVGDERLPDLLIARERGVNGRRGRQLFAEQVGSGDCQRGALPSQQRDGITRITKQRHSAEADAEAVAIMRVCRGAMSSSGHLLVLERVVAAPNEGPVAKFSDLQMLVSAGGRERTRKEFAALFAAAGFGLRTVTPTNCELSVIEALPLHC